MSPAIPQADHAQREIDARIERMDRLIERLHHQCPSAYPMRTTEQGVIVMTKGKRFDFEQTALGWRSDDRPTLSDGEVADVIATHIAHAAPPPSRTDALVEAIRAACPEVNAYAEGEAVRVHWERMNWRFVLDGGQWRCGDAYHTDGGVVRMVRDHIDTHTLAEDQTLEGLFRQGKLTVSVSASVDSKSFEEAVARAVADAQKRGHTPESITTKEQTMDTKSITKTLATDATEAAWRTAGSQFVKLAREPLVGLLTRHLAPGDDAFRARLAAFLETELGTALLASMLSASLSAMPQTTGDVPQKLARELRVRAMADAGDVLADVLMGPLRQVMALYLQDPQGAPQLGVAQTMGVDFARAGEKVAT